MTVLTFPAAPFPGEPLDVDPGVQAGDPGPMPPPANLERVPSITDKDPLAELIDTLSKQAHHNLEAHLRFRNAFITQIGIAAYTMRMTRLSLSDVSCLDLTLLLQGLRELQSEADELAHVIEPLVQSKH